MMKDDAWKIEAYHAARKALMGLRA